MNRLGKCLSDARRMFSSLATDTKSVCFSRRAYPCCGSPFWSVLGCPPDSCASAVICINWTEKRKEKSETCPLSHGAEWEYRTASAPLGKKYSDFYLRILSAFFFKSQKSFLVGHTVLLLTSYNTVNSRWEKEHFTECIK